MKYETKFKRLYGIKLATFKEALSDIEEFENDYFFNEKSKNLSQNSPIMKKYGEINKSIKIFSTIFISNFQFPKSHF